MRRLALAAAISLLIVNAHPAAQALAVASTGRLVQRAAGYVAHYEQDFSKLITDETYEQLVSDATGREMERRTTHGELFLTYLYAERQWVGVRDVADVDGHAVYPRDDIQDLLRQESDASIAMRIFDRNARFNIGGAIRTFNEPTMPLQVLSADRVRGFRFSRGPVTVDGGVTLVELQFHERDSPTLIRTQSGDVFSTGDILIEADTGRVRRTTLRAADAMVKAEITTTYAPDARLGMWLPLVFTERYELGKKAAREVTTCHAWYTNYQRFETSVRVLTP